MENYKKEDKLDELINKHPTIATVAVTTSVLTLMGLAYVFGKPEKQSVTFPSYEESYIDDGKLVLDVNNPDEYNLVRLHNTVTDRDNYLIVSLNKKNEGKKYIHNALDENYNIIKDGYMISIDSELDSSLENVTYENLGNLYEYIMTYDVKFEKEDNDKLVFDKEDLKELLDNVKKDIEKKRAKELILKNKK